MRRGRIRGIPDQRLGQGAEANDGAGPGADTIGASEL